MECSSRPVSISTCCSTVMNPFSHLITLTSTPRWNVEYVYFSPDYYLYDPLFPVNTDKLFCLTIDFESHAIVRFWPTTLLIRLYDSSNFEMCIIWISDIMMPRMGPPTTARQENPLYLSFRNPQWPANQIYKENALEYFCNQANTFYEMNSCNQQIIMQGIKNRTVEECLRNMQGIQYVLWYSQPPLFIICKQRRNSPTNG